jgi:hypothetical protein
LAAFLLGIIPLGLEVLALPFAAADDFRISGEHIVGGFVELAAFVLAIVFGVKARREIGESEGRLTGGGLATAGMVLGIIGVALSVLVLMLLFAAASQAANYYRGY